MSISKLSPSYFGYIGSIKDALLIVQKILDKNLNLVTRRPYEREREGLIKSGNVFVFIEQHSGIKRWTDGVAWSPSRILGKFLVYRELDKKSINEKEDKKRKKRKINDESSSKNCLSKKLTPNQNEDDNYINNAFIDVIQDSKENFVGLYGIKDQGLIKKTLSLTTTSKDLNIDDSDEKQIIHLISYYNADDVLNGKLKRPCETDLKFLRISKKLWNAVNKSPLGSKIPTEDEAYYFLDTNYQLQNMNLLQNSNMKLNSYSLNSETNNVFQLPSFEYPYNKFSNMDYESFNINELNNSNDGKNVVFLSNQEDPHMKLQYSNFSHHSQFLNIKNQNNPPYLDKEKNDDDSNNYTSNDTKLNNFVRLNYEKNKLIKPKDDNNTELSFVNSFTNQPNINQNNTDGISMKTQDKSISMLNNYIIGNQQFTNTFVKELEQDPPQSQLLSEENKPYLEINNNSTPLSLSTFPQVQNTFPKIQHVYTKSSSQNQSHQSNTQNSSINQNTFSSFFNYTNNLNDNASHSSLINSSSRSMSENNNHNKIRNLNSNILSNIPDSVTLYNINSEILPSEYLNNSTLLNDESSDSSSSNTVPEGNNIANFIHNRHNSSVYNPNIHLYNNFNSLNNNLIYSGDTLNNE